MEKIILHNYFRSSTSYRVRIGLNIKQIPYEYRAVHLLQDGGQQHQPKFVLLNPQKEVPTLVHGDKVIAQSMAILEYLEEIYPFPRLLPEDPWRRARVRQICENINSFIHPVNNLKILQYLESQHLYDQIQKEKWIQHWTTIGLKALETLVSQTHGQFAMGDSVTFADLFIVPQFFSAQRFNVDLTPYPILSKINEECLKIEAFQKAHPMEQPDAPIFPQST